MDKCLSQEEIDVLINNATQNAQNDNEKSISDEQEKIETLSNQLYNQNEDLIKNIISEEQNNELLEEKIDSLSNYLYNQNTDLIKDIIAKKQEYTEEEIKYMDSPYYTNLSNLINNIDSVAQAFAHNIMYNVMQKQFLDKNVNYFGINNIGFPVPDKFLNQLKLSLKMKLEQFIQIDGWGDINIDIKPIQYSNRYGSTIYTSENMYKKVDCYNIEISINKIKKDINGRKK